MLLIVVLTSAILAYLDYKKIDWKRYDTTDFEDIRKIFDPIVTLTGIILTALMVLILIINYITVPYEVATRQQEHDSLVYQLENDIYSDDITTSSKSDLYQRIESYNKYVVSGRAMQNNLWVGVFYPINYWQYELIELK